MTGVNAEIEPAGERAAQLLVEHRFGTDHGVAAIVADDQGVAGIGQVAVADADLDDRHGGSGFVLNDRRCAGEAETADVGGGGDAVDRRCGRQDEAFLARRSARPSRGCGRKEPGLAIDQNVEIAGEGFGLGAQCVVGGVFDIPGGHAGQAAGLPAHRAVAFAGGDEFEALEIGAPPGVSRT